MTPTLALDTPRLRLRARTVDDADALFPSFADAAAMTYWSHAPHRAIDETRARFATTDDGWRTWAITRGDDDRAIGFVAAGEKRPGVSEIGYMLARDQWGLGVARAAVGAVLDQLFRIERQRRVFADTDPDNAPSNALLHALGFQREGLLRAEWETHIGIRDTVLWGLLASEWIDR